MPPQHATSDSRLPLRWSPYSGFNRVFRNCSKPSPILDNTKTKENKKELAICYHSFIGRIDYLDARHAEIATGEKIH
jgi:hypothetical protein